MRRLLTGLTIAMLLTATSAFAQVEVGLGLGAPITARSIPTSAHIDNAGTVRVDETLDASPQIVIEVHRTFKLREKLAFGPYLAFAPKIDFGTSSNIGSQTPLGAGFGLLLSTNAGAKHRINFGGMWLITTPLTQVNPAWRDGFQAPRSSQDLPQEIRFEKGSVSRLMLTMTVSGIF